MASFRPAEHLRRRAEFERVYRDGFKLSGRLMTMFAGANRTGHARLGVAATRRLGGAVLRNRARRLTRELFRHHKPEKGLDIVVIPRPEFLDAAYTTLEREFSALLGRATRPEGGDARRRGSRVDPRV
jgi:ribonuclease P protein component